MRKRTKALLLAMVLLIGSMGALAPARNSAAADPLVLRGIFVFIKSVKRATADRAEAIGAVNAGRDENLRDLEQARAVADYYADRGWITPEQQATVHAQADGLQTGFEDLARRERQIVRHDTQFTRVLAENLRAEARISAPQILVKLGVPELAARIAGSALQGEKPLSAVLDAAITKVTGGPLVDPTQDPLADLKAQLGALQEATDALGGASKVKIAAELLGIQQKLEEISGLPLPDQGAELGTLRRVIEEAEGTLAEAGALRNEWLPRWMGPGNERFARDSKWQAIFEELQRDAESRVEGAIAAGMAATNEQRLIDALEAAGIEPTEEAIANLRSALAQATAEGWAAGQRPRADELIQQVLGREPTPATSATAAASPTEGPSETAEPSPTEAPMSTPTPSPTPTPTPTPTATPTPKPTATATPAPAATATATLAPSPTATATPSPSGVSVAAGISLMWEQGTVPLQLTLDVNFDTGSVSGTFGGAITTPDSANCTEGGTVIDVSTGVWTDTYSGSVSGGVDPASGAFSGSVSFTHSWSFQVTQLFTHPSCTQFNTSPPQGGSHAGSGTFSGSASAAGAVNFSMNTDHGPASWSGTGSVY